MIHHTCQDCQRGFTATSHDEAEEEYQELYKDDDTVTPSFEGAVKINEVAYAQYCPYCGGTNVEAR